MEPLRIFKERVRGNLLQPLAIKTETQDIKNNKEKLVSYILGKIRETREARQLVSVTPVHDFNSPRAAASAQTVSLCRCRQRTKQNERPTVTLTHTTSNAKCCRKVSSDAYNLATTSCQKRRGAAEKGHVNVSAIHPPATTATPFQFSNFCW